MIRFVIQAGVRIDQPVRWFSVPKCDNKRKRRRRSIASSWPVWYGSSHCCQGPACSMDTTRLCHLFLAFVVHFFVWQNVTGQSKVSHSVNKRQSHIWDVPQRFWPIIAPTAYERSNVPLVAPRAPEGPPPPHIPQIAPRAPESIGIAKAPRAPEFPYRGRRQAQTLPAIPPTVFPNGATSGIPEIPPTVGNLSSPIPEIPPTANGSGTEAPEVIEIPVTAGNSSLPEPTEIPVNILMSCSFSEPVVAGQICDWMLPEAEKYNRTAWRIGSGSEAYFLGGPPKDASGSSQGKFAFYDASSFRFAEPKHDSGWLISKVYPPTGPEGRCLSFDYSFYGLGLDSIRVLLVSSKRVPPEPATTPGSSAGLGQLLGGLSSLLPAAQSPSGAGGGGGLGSLLGSLGGLNSFFNPAAAPTITTTTTTTTTTPAPTSIANLLPNNAALNAGGGNLGLFDFLNPESQSALNFEEHALLPQHIREMLVARHLSRRVRGLQGFPTLPSLPSLSRLFSPPPKPIPGDIISYDTYLLWEHSDSTQDSSRNGGWEHARISFASQTDYQIVFETMPSPVLNRYQGYAAIDNTVLQDATCPTHCHFEAGFCDWSNIVVQMAQDEFDWSLGRGTTNTVTGPIRDHPSSEYTRPAGGYAYIDSSFPRRPGDQANLYSPTFRARETPFCLIFWVNVYGNHIGALAVKVVPLDGSPNVTVWNMRATDAVGLPDVWYMAQATITSPTDFKIVMEATVGTPNAGDIAIDDIGFEPGSCAAKPSIAAPPGHCAFEDDLCGWSMLSVRQAPYSPPLWTRVSGDFTKAQPLGHTQQEKFKQDFYMRFETDNVQHAPLDRAWLLSPLLNANNDTLNLCLVFWVDQYSLVPGREGLGALQVLLVDSVASLPPVNVSRSVIWRLTNHQEPRWIKGQVAFNVTRATRVAFEGIEGLRTMGTIAIDDIAVFQLYDRDTCKTLPERAEIVPSNCWFDTESLCGWTSNTGPTGYPLWKVATVDHSPTSLVDHTFGAPMAGFLYFDPYLYGGSVQEATLASADIPNTRDPGQAGLCFSFWYMALGIDAGATLAVAIQTNSYSAPQEVWRVSHNEVAQGSFNAIWMLGQVMVSSGPPLSPMIRIVVQGKSTYGVFAIDDVHVDKVEVPCAKFP